MEIENLKIRIRSELEQALGHKLPPLLTTKEIDKFNIRTKASLDHDACNGTGLLPIPGKSGRPRKYLTTDVINFVIGEKQSVPPASRGIDV